MTFNPAELPHLEAAERIRSYEEMPRLIYDLGRVGLEAYLVQGVMDIVHGGHIGYVQAAHQLDPANSVVIVGLENDETVRRNKGQRRPINPLVDRLLVVAEFRSVAFAFGYPDTPDYDDPESYLDRWRTLRPSAVVAASWDPHRDLKEWQAQQTGTRIAYVEYHHQNSTTRMLRSVGYE